MSLGSVFLLTACVTINIYFPAKAADKVADEIIRGIQDQPAGKTTPKQEPEARGLDQHWVILQSIDRVLNLLVPVAQAAEANLAIDTAEIRALRASMKQRFSALQSFYSRGFIGIQANGLLAARNPGSIPLKERNRVKQLVAAENRDRNALYQAIANANGHPEWLEQIRNTFAKRWISNARSGWFYQDAQGNWQAK